MKHRGGAHEFALYVPIFSNLELKSGSTINFTEQEFIHRVSRVLRLDAGDRLVLFDAKRHLYVLIKKISKNMISVDIENVAHNATLKPDITLLLPLLKREALEQAVYSAVELGVNQIQLIITEKVQRHWQGRELERLQHIMIAAAEQSKYFSLPELHAPISLLELQLSGCAIFFDPEGEPLADTLMKKLWPEKMVSCTVIVGPEGDLTESEKFYLQKQQVMFVRLTPTILRAQQAVALGVGTLRSFFSIP